MVKFIQTYMSERGTVSKAYATNTQTDTNGTSFTFAGVSIGTASDERYVLVAAGAMNGTNGDTITGITIGGVAATQLIQATQDDSTAAFYILSVPTGTTATIVVSVSGTKSRCGIGVWALTNLGDPTPLDTDSITSASGTTLNLPTMTSSTTGVFIGYGANHNGSSSSWTGTTSDFATGVGSASWHTGGSSVPAGSTIAPSVNFVSSGTKKILLGVTF